MQESLLQYMPWKCSRGRQICCSLLLWNVSLLIPFCAVTRQMLCFQKQLNFQILKVWSYSWKGNCVVSSKVFINVTVQSKTSWLKVFLGSHEVLPCVLGTIPYARFSKVPVIYGPVNLPGPLSGNFIGPEVTFLKAPVNLPGTYRGPEKIAGHYQTLARSLYGRPREENKLELCFIRIIHSVRLFERIVFLFRFEGQCNMF